MGKDIKQRVTINATPVRVFEALMDGKKHAAFTQAPAKISRKVGGKFTAYGPYIEGINVELIRGKRIVQAWRGNDWPKGVYSIATFELAAELGVKTTLTFKQSGVPAGFVKSIEQGWKDHYWNRLKTYFAKPVRRPRRK
ncbi:MAG: SRPBCC domain-containing protein [Deltaproteobacteria bacterium]|jgi:activator of HSP90 ATPase|nr:SRPBCC domain-containing protein [Deltaproteobacteria bacterium]MBW2534702.1 SRPBCC domain-containing protein [Deltaproteobacteria bacterium]